MRGLNAVALAACLLLASGVIVSCGGGGGTGTTADGGGGGGGGGTGTLGTDPSRSILFIHHSVGAGLIGQGETPPIMRTAVGQYNAATSPTG